MPDLTVINNTDANRYELHLGNELVGFADYRRSGAVLAVPHVEVDPAHGGQGFGGQLMKGLLLDLRTKHEKIDPICPFAAAYIAQHPTNTDLLS